MVVGLWQFVAGTLTDIGRRSVFTPLDLLVLGKLLSVALRDLHGKALAQSITIGSNCYYSQAITRLGTIIFLFVKGFMKPKHRKSLGICNKYQ